METHLVVKRLKYGARGAGQSDVQEVKKLNPKKLKDLHSYRLRPDV